MSDPPAQPEASSSTSASPPPLLAPHLATFVFDTCLPRTKYSKLIEADGVVHKLVQRLMEKHGGENNLRISLLINPSSNRTKARSNIFRQEYNRPSAFLTSLPSLTEQFPLPGRVTANRKWPTFGVDDTASPIHDASEKKRKRGVEARLLQGVVGGLELLHRSSTEERRSPPRTMLTLTPTSASPLFDSLTTPSHRPEELTPPTSLAQRYLIVVSSNGETAVTNEALASPDLSNWDVAWDKNSWTDLAGRCRSREYKCSCILVGPKDDGETPSKKLKTLCTQASSALPDAPWFDVPPDIDLTLSGYSLETIDESAVPTPLLEMASSVGTEHIQTPVTNPQLTSDPRALQQMQNQAMQARMAQIARAISSSTMNGGKMDPQLIQTISAAMKSMSGNGPMDVNDPRWQPIRQVLQLHQQQRQAAATAGGSGPSEQAVMAAIQQQRAMQAQQGGGGQQLPAMASQTTKSNQHVLWAGTMSWGGPQANGAQQVIHLDATHFTGGMDGLLVHQWPQDLRLQNVVTIDLPTLTSYARTMKAPCVTFAPNANSPDSGANAQRYSQLVNSLNQKGNMVVIPFSAPDRGIILFSAPTPGTGVGSTPRNCKMMGVVCLAAPFPSIGTTNNGTGITQNQNQNQAVDNSVQMAQQIQQQQQQQQQQAGMQQNAFRPSPLQPQAQLPPAAAAIGQAQGQGQGQGQGQYNPIQAQAMQQQLQQFQLMQQQQQQQQQQTFPPPQQQQQQLQQPSFPSQPQQPEPRRGISLGQYNTIMSHAQKYGMHFPPFDHTTIPLDQVTEMLASLQAADNKLKYQKQQQQQLQQQQQQQQQQGGQLGQEQIQMAQLQMMLQLQQQQQQQQQGQGFGGYQQINLDGGQMQQQPQQGQYIQQ